MKQTAARRNVPGGGGLPGDVRELTAAWVGEMLAEAGVVPAGTRVNFTAEVIGVDRGFTGQVVRVTWRTGEGAGTVIAKIPDAAQNFERCAREVRFYEHLAPDIGDIAPRFVWGVSDETAQGVVVVLAEVTGELGDVMTGCSLEQTTAVIDAMAAMHGRWADHPAKSQTERWRWLPRWGSGESGVAHPHRRAAQRFGRRVEPFFEHFGQHAAPGFEAMARAMVDTYESVLESATSLPLTLIHGDLHLDNLIFGVDRHAPPVTILDWQSVSVGPAAYDLARWLTGTLRGASSGDAATSLIERYHRKHRETGAPTPTLPELHEHYRLMLHRILGGFISGYGGRDPASMVERERAMVASALSEEGLAGVVLAGMGEG